MTEFEQSMEFEDGPSRTQIKKDMKALQGMGEELTKLTPEQLKRAPLEEDLQEAVRACQRIKKHEARRRQFQYIGKLMREVEIEPIQEFLDEIGNVHTSGTREFHELEQWRDRMIDGDDELIQELINRFEEIDVQRFRQLIRNARKEREKQKTPKSARLLFKMLRELRANEVTD